MNLFFQSAKSRILELDSTLANFYTELLLSYMNRAHVKQTPPLQGVRHGSGGERHGGLPEGGSPATSRLDRGGP